MQYAGRLADRGAILLWVPVVCREAAEQTPEEDRKGLEKRGSHPSATEEEKPQVTAAQGFVHKCTEKTKTDFTLSTPFLVTLIYGNIFFFLSFHLLLLLDKI